MPELPEVETVCRGLADKLVGRRLVRTIVVGAASVGFHFAESTGHADSRNLYWRFVRSLTSK